MFSTTMTPGHTGPWPKIPPTRAPSSAPGPSLHTQFWAAYTTGMRESNFRYTHPSNSRQKQCKRCRAPPLFLDGSIQHHRAADYVRRIVEITKGILHRRRLGNLTSRLKPIYSDNAHSPDELYLQRAPKSRRRHESQLFGHLGGKVFEREGIADIRQGLVTL